MENMGKITFKNVIMPNGDISNYIEAQTNDYGEDIVIDHLVELVALENSTVSISRV